MPFLTGAQRWRLAAKEIEEAVISILAETLTSPAKGITGEGLKEAMASAQVVIDVANSPFFEDKAVLGMRPPVPRPPAAVVCS